MVEPMVKLTLLFRPEGRDQFITELQRFGLVHVEQQRVEENTETSRLATRITHMLQDQNYLRDRAESLDEPPAIQSYEGKPEDLVRTIDSIRSRIETAQTERAQVRRELLVAERWGEFDPEKIEGLESYGLQMSVHSAPRALAEEVDPSRYNPAWMLVGDGREVFAVTVAGALTPAPGDDRSLEGDGTACPVGERWWVALNEMVLEKTVPGHMVTLSTAVDGERFLDYKADGVLVATPTGSTAYNLSAGGPVLSPGLPAMVLTPVAPHLAIDRSVVLRADQVVTVSILPGRPAVLVIDGREVGRLAPEAEVACQVADRPLHVVCPGERGFAAPLRAALTYGRYQ